MYEMPEKVVELLIMLAGARFTVGSASKVTSPNPSIGFVVVVSFTRLDEAACA
ncbi:hypothetical protein SDC9_135782 [bioreactor metagenome]|uniref:Uncharacterized protein n=1 Tax=bioreactor metagenome TaxID=1076179 RepID=A0A645DI43_9ZZZZ